MDINNTLSQNTEQFVDNTKYKVGIETTTLSAVGDGEVTASISILYEQSILSYLAIASNLHMLSGDRRPLAVRVQVTSGLRVRETHQIPAVHEHHSIHLFLIIRFYLPTVVLVFVGVRGYLLEQ